MDKFEPSWVRYFSVFFRSFYGSIFALVILAVVTCLTYSPIIGLLCAPLAYIPLVLLIRDWPFYTISVTDEHVCISNDKRTWEMPLRTIESTKVHGSIVTITGGGGTKIVAKCVKDADACKKAIDKAVNDMHHPVKPERKTNYSGYLRRGSRQHR